MAVTGRAVNFHLEIKVCNLARGKRRGGNIINAHNVLAAMRWPYTEWCHGSAIDATLSGAISRAAGPTNGADAAVTARSWKE